MHARVATFEGVDVAASAATMEEANRRVEPLIREMRGLQRAVDLADRSSGRMLSIAFFDSEENMNAAEPIFDEEMPRVLGDLMENWSGRRTSVERYEVVFDQSAG
jgi:allantoicase